MPCPQKKKRCSKFNTTEGLPKREKDLIEQLILLVRHGRIETDRGRAECVRFDFLEWALGNVTGGSVME